MQLTYHTDYALRLLIYLQCNPGRWVSTREIAQSYTISLHHLTKVAKSLTQKKWVITVRGGQGGLMLGPDSASLRVGEIVRYTEGESDLVECLKEKLNTCPIDAVCRLKPLFYRARKAFFQTLDSMTLEEIARNKGELNAILLPKPLSKRGA